jgi:hypothetical protein
MANETDMMKMDAHQRHAWLLANRATLMVVGVVWLGMIVQRLMTGETPVFMIAMVPVFALARFGAYLFYRGRAGRAGLF